MLQFGNKEFRNLQEQVLKNMQDIANISEGTAVLSEFGIKVVGEVDELADLPTVNEYKAAHADWEYGDAFAIGTTAPYTLVILTRANDDIDTDHWFDIGDFPAPGPTGPAGPMGETGPQGPTGNPGPAGADAGFGSVLATAQTLPAGSAATATVQVAGPNTAKEFSFTFGIPRGADGSTPVWGNIIGTMSDQTDLKNALDSKQDDLVSGTNIKTINGNSVLGSGNIEINSGVWGNITGTLSNQTDLKNALDAKANSADLAAVATTGDYDDLIDKPTIGAGTITIKKNGATIDSFDVNQTSNQNINIVVPTKTSDITNDSDYTTKTYVDNKLDLKADKSTTYTKTQIDTALSAKANTADLATVATSGSYQDLSNKPDLSIYAETSDLSQVAFSGSYNDLLNKPELGDVITISSYTETLSAADLAKIVAAPYKCVIKNSIYTFYPMIATSSIIRYACTSKIDDNSAEVRTFKLTLSTGVISDYYLDTLVPNTRTINGKALSSNITLDASDLNLATVATSGSYNDLLNKPLIIEYMTLSGTGGTLSADDLAKINANPDQYIIVRSDVYYRHQATGGTNIRYESTAGQTNNNLYIEVILINKTTGVWTYNRRTNTSVTGTNDGTLWTGLTIGSDTYAIPTKTSDITNDSGFITQDNASMYGKHLLDVRTGSSYAIDATTLADMVANPDNYVLRLYNYENRRYLHIDGASTALIYGWAKGASYSTLTINTSTGVVTSTNSTISVHTTSEVLVFEDVEGNESTLTVITSASI